MHSQTRSRAQPRSHVHWDWNWDSQPRSHAHWDWDSRPRSHVHSHVHSHAHQHAHWHAHSRSHTPHAPVLDTIHQLHILVAHAGRTTFLHAHTHREHISSLHALLLAHETHAPNAIRGNPSRREAHMKTHKSGSNTPHTCSRRRPPPLRPPRASPSPPAGLTGTREAYGPTNEPPGLKLNEPKRL